MSDENGLESLQVLHADLVAFSQARFMNLDRLEGQLVAHIEAFKHLLNKKARNEKSRQSLATGKLEVSGDEYSINEEFQQGALKLADELNLDEIEAAQLFLEVQDQTDSSGQPPLTNAIIRFHQRRQYLLDCLRLLFQFSADVNREEKPRQSLQDLVRRIIEVQNGSPRFTERCLSEMSNIKSWLQLLAEKLNSATVLGQKQADILDVIEFQRASLVRQHETLATMILYLVKENHSVNADFLRILDFLSKAEKYDNLLLHHFPVLSACITRYGGPEGGAVLADARALNEKVFAQTDQNPWILNYVHATFKALWLAEYSGWYWEHHDVALPENQLEDEARQRAQQFGQALKDGAFDFILSIAADVKSTEWYDPARHGLRQWLQRKAPVILPDSVSFAESFETVLMEQLEVFIEGFITHLPDVLRKLRVDEDEQRQLSKEHEHELDLEKFVIIISYVFEGRPKSAQQNFWDEPDGPMLGFVYWASKRASTPLVCAFCEMLQAISEDEECATAAHAFLIGEGIQSSGQMRRMNTLSWNQIFKELAYSAGKLRDRPALPQPQSFRPGKPHIDLAEAEPESAMLLESYLRLITCLCTESEASRNFLAHHPDFNISEHLFQLTSSSIQPRLRACAFSTLRSLLSHKTKETGEYMWAGLDVWISGGYSPGSTMARTAANASMTTTAASMAAILRGLASGYEEPNAFVQLLNALVSPYVDESGLHDGLPFPENLGITSRQPGIDPYIDFAMGQIFAAQSIGLDDALQSTLLKLSCLRFIITCLSTFNEDLVVLGSHSSVAIDAAIRTTDLRTYVLLHPFTRTMEWMFNEKVMTVLFKAAQQDSGEVARAAPDSPLVLCVLSALEVINLILDLQTTYLDIIRPYIKSQSNHRRTPVANAAFATFEDGILNHLDIISDLGLYCGSGHTELIITSLKLLERFSASPKLAAGPTSILGGRSERNRTLSALDDTAEIVSKILLGEMQTDIDYNEGPGSPSYVIKIRVLDFLLACLRATPNRPTIAHLLLGFHCGIQGISAVAGTPFDRSASLFHAVMNMALFSPVAVDSQMSSLLVTLSFKAFQILKELWASPMSSSITMTEMRVQDTFFVLFANETIIQPSLTWDGLEFSDPSFLSSDSAGCLSRFLGRRGLILQYLAAELRQVGLIHSPSLKQRMLETLFGSTTVDNGTKQTHSNVFDWFDFMDPDFGGEMLQPATLCFADIDFSVCTLDGDDFSPIYNMKKVEQLILLRKSELSSAKQLEHPQDLAIFLSQAQELIDYYTQNNQTSILNASRLEVLRTWTQLALMMIEGGDFDATTKTSFVSTALQTIMPRLESEFDSVLEATELARLAKALVFTLDFGSDSFKSGEGDSISDKLFHLFQVSLKAINTLGSRTSLKEYYYNICYRYLTGMSDVSGISGIQKRHSLQTIKSAGERFIGLVCDDAYAGDPNCRIAALLVLTSLVRMGNKENSKYIIDTLIRLNFIGILIDSIQHMYTDLHDTPVEGVDMQLSYSHARLALLLALSQTRFGASAVLNAGLFHSVKESGLFAVDPDLGVDIKGPNSIEKHYDLLGAIMRVVCGTILSRGTQNQQTMEQGRKFLSEYRPSILAVLKKSAGLGNAVGGSEQSIDELAESYMLLMSVTGFLDAEEETTQSKQGAKVFTAFT